jgi:UDP-N-acetylmuramate: L-alanyl-gamma-D-glutamyl-meso-diaminopimelate ligase
VFCYAGSLSWDVHNALTPLGGKAIVEDDLDRLTGKIVEAALPGDHILVMSNGSFGGIHKKLLESL